MLQKTVGLPMLLMGLAGLIVWYLLVFKESGQDHPMWTYILPVIPILAITILGLFISSRRK